MVEVPDEPLILQARRAREADLERLANMSPAQIEYLGQAEDGELLEHDDEEPKLTAEEWAFIREVTDG